MAIPFARYRLSRAALDQRRFLATELAASTGVPLNTVYSFISDLGTRVTSESLGAGTVGRPQKLYTLTDEGVAYLLDRNLELVRSLSLGGESRPLMKRARQDTPAEQAASRGLRAPQLDYAREEA